MKPAPPVIRIRFAMEGKVARRRYRDSRDQAAACFRGGIVIKIADPFPRAANDTSSRAASARRISALRNKRARGCVRAFPDNQNLRGDAGARIARVGKNLSGECATSMGHFSSRHARHPAFRFRKLDP
jgi:hypothetical protein